MSIAAIEALQKHQRQLDEDGIEVGVSRQALDEVLAQLAQAQRELERMTMNWTLSNQAREKAEEELEEAQNKLAEERLYRPEKALLQDRIDEARNRIRQLEAETRRYQDWAKAAEKERDEARSSLHSALAENERLRAALSIQPCQTFNDEPGSFPASPTGVRDCLNTGSTPCPPCAAREALASPAPSPEPGSNAGNARHYSPDWVEKMRAVVEAARFLDEHMDCLYDDRLHHVKTGVTRCPYARSDFRQAIKQLDEVAP